MEIVFIKSITDKARMMPNFVEEKIRLVKECTAFAQVRKTFVLVKKNLV